MATKKKSAAWGGHPILDEKHAHDLELKAAVNEFHHGMDRETAERHALDEYRREHHARAAAHHLHGMRAAQATGVHDDGAQHYALYRLHLKALGHEPHEAVPPEVKQYMEGDQAERTYRFKGHGADQFLVTSVRGPVPAMQKSEPPEDPAKRRLVGYLVGLAKGEVVQFPTPEDRYAQMSLPERIESLKQAGAKFAAMLREHPEWEDGPQNLCRTCGYDIDDPAPKPLKQECPTCRRPATAAVAVPGSGQTPTPPATGHLRPVK